MRKFACVFLAGCAGRAAAPVSQYQMGDEKKPCEHLRGEIAEIDANIARKTQTVQNRYGGNAALAVAGMFLFWPALFFMDLSEADKTELEAMRQRRNALTRICVDKDCGDQLAELPPIETVPKSLEEERQEQQ